MTNKDIIGTVKRGGMADVRQFVRWLLRPFTGTERDS